MMLYKLVVLGDGGVGKVLYHVPLDSCFSNSHRHFVIDCIDHPGKISKRESLFYVINMLVRYKLCLNHFVGKLV